MNRKNTELLLFSLIVVLVVAVCSSLAYVLYGFKWPVGTVVTYYVNENTVQVNNEGSAVRSAANSWSNIFPTGLRLLYSGSTSVIDSNLDGNNTICWKDRGDIDALATAYSWYWVGTKYLAETDMVFNDYYSWSTSGSQNDVETVALHEFGHWVGLDHSDSGIMYYMYSGIQRSIDSDAIAGFMEMYSSQEEKPSIQLDRSSLSFTGLEGQTLLPSEEFNIRNSGKNTLYYGISTNRSWLSVSPSSGSSSGEWDTIETLVNISGLSSGSYSGTVSVTSNNADNSPQNLSVSLTVQEEKPSIQLDRSFLSFTGGEGQSQLPSQQFRIRNSGKKTLYYGISTNRSWLSVSPSSGSSTGEWDTIETVVNVSGLSSGNYSGTVSVTSSNADNSPQNMSVYLTVLEDSPPTVSITSPRDGDIVSKTITVKANASDDKGVKKVEFFLDNVVKKTDVDAPYEWSWDTTTIASGFHNIKAKAFDTIDQTAEHSIQVKVDQPPEVSITSPKDGDIVSKTITVKADASDDNGVQKVEFYIDDSLKNTDVSAPYEWTWDTTSIVSGTHILKAKAFDTISQTTEHSIQVKVDQPPEISITSPTAGSDLFGIVPIQVSASDDLGIKKVEFYVNGEINKTDNESPYSYDWNTNVIFNGGYNIKTVVYDTIDQTAQAEIAVLRIPHAPLEFKGKKHNNSSVFLEQYINILTWRINNLNRNILRYRIFHKVGEEWLLLKEMDTSELEYWHWNVEKHKDYAYAITAVDNEAGEGELAYAEVK